MARKKFHFDFNEDAEPVEELHRFRAAVADHFKTVEAIREYINSAPTAEEFLARLDTKEKQTAPKTVKRRARPAGMRRGRRKTAKRLVHA